MKKIPAVLAIFTAFLTAFIFFIPLNNTSFAQECSGPDDSSSCGPGLSCVDPEGEGNIFECRAPQRGFGEACKTNDPGLICAGSMTCIPDSPGNENGKCGTVKEGSFCNPSNSDSCGGSNTSPLRCREDANAGGPTCQRVRCSPAQGDTECKAINPALFCINEADGAFCAFEAFVNRVINVRINYKNKVNLQDGFERDSYAVELKLEGKVIKTAYTQKIEEPATGKDDSKEISITLSTKFEDISPGTYEVCVPEIAQCKDVTKISKEPGKPNPVTFDAEDEGIPPPPLPPCAVTDGAKCREFDTALGNWMTDPAGFVRSVFGILLAASGSIALLLIIRAGYQIMTSKGNPEAVQEGRERIIAAIVGLLFLIFSFVFLQLIGVDLLRIPGLGGSTSTPSEPRPPGTITDLSCMDIYSIGSSGRCVQNIRRFFNIEPVDGIYDQETEDAVRKFQSENGIYPDGDVGPCTTGKMRGHEVDPVCSGPLDEAALRQFQTEKGLIVDGKFGGCTWRALIGDPIPESCTR